MPDSIGDKLEKIQLLMRKHELDCDAPEFHGIVTGLICSGQANDSTSWQGAIQDLLNDGMDLDKALSKEVAVIHADIKSALEDTDMVFAILLPDDDELLSDRAISLVQWVQGFLIGFSMSAKAIATHSEDVKEVLEDFSEITKLDPEMESNEDGEQAIFEVMEYVKVSVLLCFNECNSQYTSVAQPGSDLLH